ncbi:hypothetical protein Psuf_074800 [Phytohabitans suffuscus]|uniref:Uncharacterized protein n=1 Tax=Phytohabitans suffuscus TaxID=624315 RepID=A0A6F8YVK1_9ACTN|nr:hypothetical protein Psuf_074800 [Phytohabitans suffuscus]
MFQIASTVRRPGKRERSTWCETTASGCWLPPSTTATRVFPTKYSQFAVRWRAVKTQVNVTDEPTVRAGHARLSSFSTANWDRPPSQLRSPLGPSTLCGSNWICPQSGTARDAHRAWRLGGAETYPWADAAEPVATRPAAAVPAITRG